MKKRLNEIYANHTGRTIDEIKKANVIARGNGRSYGDSSIGESVTVHMKYFNQIISFDETRGLLVAESGVLLKDIINTFEVCCDVNIDFF
mgnify:CR=1 FL=1